LNEQVQTVTYLFEVELRVRSRREGKRQLANNQVCEGSKAEKKAKKAFKSNKDAVQRRTLNRLTKHYGGQKNVRIGMSLRRSITPSLHSQGGWGDLEDTDLQLLPEERDALLKLPR
jgi:hypothetical protein